MISPHVSVIVPCYKMGRYVAEALESVGAQTYSAWEVLVVDDAGPEDGTRQAVADFAKRFPEHRVEFTRLEVNGGVSAARNTAIRAARGRFLAFLDPDDQWCPEKLEKQLAIFESDESVAVCYSLARICRSGAGIDPRPGVELFGNQPEQETAAAILAVASGKVMFTFSTVILKKEVFEKVGGFQEQCTLGEDRLLIGCSALFGRMAWLPEPLCVYRRHDGSATATVIQRETTYLVEFDLVARLSLWLRRDPRGSELGSRIVRDVLRVRLKQALRSRSWFRWRSMIIGHCAKLALNYPSVTGFLIGQLLWYCPARAVKRTVARFLPRRGAGPNADGSVKAGLTEKQADKPA